MNKIKQWTRGWLWDKVGYGCFMPWWMGQAYIVYSEQVGIVVLMPFNWIVALSLSFYWWVKMGPRKSRYEAVMRRILRDAGYDV